MALNLLRRVRKKVTDHVVDFAQQTALGGPKYSINHGTIKGGKDVKTGKDILIKMSRFDRLVGFVFTSSVTNCFDLYKGPDHVPLSTQKSPTEAPHPTFFRLTYISLQHGFGLETRKFA